MKVLTPFLPIWSSLKYLSDDAKAFLLSSIIMVLWVESVKILAKLNLMNTWMRRKVMHVGTGPLFILLWPQFSASGSIFASMVPLAMTLKFALIGLGLLKDDDAVNSMARSGKKEELLRGPLAYGMVFVLSTATMWKQYRSVIALFSLCFGDGAAEAFGRRFGRTIPLPWNQQKSWAGSAGFVFTATLCTYVFTMYLIQRRHQQQSLSLTALWHMTAPVIPRLLAVHTTGTTPLLLLLQFIIALLCTYLSALIESLPLGELDNIAVFVAAAFADTVFGQMIPSAYSLDKLIQQSL